MKTLMAVTFLAGLVLGVRAVEPKAPASIPPNNYNGGPNGWGVYGDQLLANVKEYPPCEHLEFQVSLTGLKPAIEAEAKTGPDSLTVHLYSRAGKITGRFGCAPTGNAGYMMRNEPLSLLRITPEKAEVVWEFKPTEAQEKGWAKQAKDDRVEGRASGTIGNVTFANAVVAEGGHAFYTRQLVPHPWAAWRFPPMRPRKRPWRSAQRGRSVVSERGLSFAPAGAWPGGGRIRSEPLPGRRFRQTAVVRQT
jgi:hypothetical protein